MKKYRICPYCNQEFENIEGRVFSNHVRWCDKNPNRNKSKKNISNGVQKSYDKKQGKLTEFEVVCSRCNKTFKVVEKEKLFPQKNIYYCSSFCAHKRTQTNLTKNKIKKKICDNLGIDFDPYKRYLKKCKRCGKEYSNKNRKFCSQECLKIYRRETMNINEYRSFYLDCQFNFDLKMFSNEFNFELIEEFGWYSPTNKKNNLGGISRDHIVSIKYAYENKIPAKYIRHPANCQLLKQTDNIRKYKNNIITFRELLQRIYLWEKKYGAWDC
jgi:hypothetical protein